MNKRTEIPEVFTVVSVDEQGKVISINHSGKHYTPAFYVKESTARGQVTRLNKSLEGSKNKWAVAKVTELELRVPADG